MQAEREVRGRWARRTARRAAGLTAGCAVALSMALGGCRSLPLDSSRRDAEPIMWPPAPAEPRIVYLSSLGRPTDVGVKSPWWRTAVGFLTGGRRDRVTFERPFGIFVDDADDLCLTDIGAGAVYYFDRGRKRFKRWDRIGDNQLVSPVAIVKHDNTFFVADTGLGKILAFNERGKLTFEIADRLKQPAGLAISGQTLLVADAQEHRILRFDLAGRFLSQFGQRGAMPGEINFPTHLAVNSAGRRGDPEEGALYVTDAMNFRVQVFDVAGKFLATIGSIGDSTGHFSRPKGIGVDGAGHIYVVDALFDNVQIFDAAGQFLMHWGSAGSTPGEFWLPAGIAIGPDNRIYVADSYNQRVQVFQGAGEQ
jgi:DNA-binding beta-propeller fold protein YncE